jgi:hypothetical protein
LPTIAPEASAVASQMRKRTTATERIRARDAINPECFRVNGIVEKKLKGYKVKEGNHLFPFNVLTL